jgi:predicted nucleic acid-binding protein
VFVVDASVVLAWCFADQATEDADRVLDRLQLEEAVTPAIWPLEVANGLRTAERRGRIHPGELPRIRELLGALPVRIEAVELETALGEVLEVARSLDPTAYDAAYLSLASRRNLALTTIDGRLRQAGERAGIEFMVQPLRPSGALQGRGRAIVGVEGLFGLPAFGRVGDRCILVER